MKKSEVKEIVSDEIDKLLEKKIDDIVKKTINNNSSKSRKEILELIKDSLEAAFKVFWVKRDFWKRDIK